LSEFRKAVRDTFRDAARCRNFIVSTLVRLDDAAFSDYEGRQPKFALTPEHRNGLYGRAVKRFPGLDATTVTTLVKEVTKHYVKHRFFIWDICTESMPNYKAPGKLPLAAAAVRIDESEAGFLVRLPIGGGLAKSEKFNRRQFVVLLPKGGKDWARNAPMMRGVIATAGRTRQEAGAARVAHEAAKDRGEVSGRKKVDRDRVKPPYDHGTATLFEGGDGDLFFKLYVHLPVEGREKRADRVLAIQTGPDDLLTCDCRNFKGSDRPRFHEDGLRRAILAHSFRTKRFGEDVRSCRFGRDAKKGMAGSQEARCEAHGNVIDDRLKKIARTIADYARGHHVGAVVYDDADRSWVKPFPWAKLRDKIRDKLDLYGIPHSGLGAEDVDATGTGHPEDPHDAGPGSLEEDMSCPTATGLIANLARQTARIGAGKSNVKPGSGRVLRPRPAK